MVDSILSVTRFKYRTTIPTSPKVGTFYWVEPENEEDIALYLSTSGGLKRLDSKIQQLVLNGSYDVISLSEPDENGEQELTVKIGSFDKDDKTSGGVRSFNVSSDNDGLSTVGETIKYVSDSNNMIYMSNAEDYWETENVGGIKKGYKKKNLKNKTISEILDDILYPTLQPTYTNPSVSLNLSYTSPIKVGTDITSILNAWTKKNIVNYISTNRGSLTYVTDEPPKYTLKNYAGSPILTTSGSSNEVTVTTTTPSSKTSAVEGKYSVTVSVYFNDGPTPLDNKRNRARDASKIDTCDCDDGCEKCYLPNFKGQYIKSSNTPTFNVVYPIYTNSTNGGNTSIQTIQEYNTLFDYTSGSASKQDIEFPAELEGFSESELYKMTIDIPSHLSVEVYQYNETNKSYDVKISLYKSSAVLRYNNTQYTRYIRTNNPTDVKTGVVKYKITIKK
jgi:hypothetical protein